MSTLWISYATSIVSEGKADNLLHPRDSLFNKPLDCMSMMSRYRVKLALCLFVVFPVESLHQEAECQ